MWNVDQQAPLTGTVTHPSRNFTDSPRAICESWRAIWACTFRLTGGAPPDGSLRPINVGSTSQEREARAGQRGACLDPYPPVTAEILSLVRAAYLRLVVPDESNPHPLS